MLEATSSSQAFQNQKLTRIGVLISGRGSNCTAIARSIREGRLPGCEIAIVVSNVPDAPGIEAARRHGLSVVTLEGRGREQRDHEEAVAAMMRKFRVDMICLAGYKRILSAAFVREWKGRILNIHASLLPAFPGRDPERQALEYGARFTGCTVSFVEEHVDSGSILLQRVVEVEDEDTPHSLAEAVRAEEHIAYTEAIARLLSGEYELRDRRYVRRVSEPLSFPDGGSSGLQATDMEPNDVRALAPGNS